MPTKKPRIFVAVTPEQDQLLSELGALQSRSKASYLLELLEGAQPLLTALLPSLRAHLATIEGQPIAVRDAVAKILTGVFGDEGPNLLDAIERADEARSAPSGARAHRVSDPPIVTRGSAIGDHGPKQGSKQGRIGRQRG
jgi:hypothetical protein